MGYLRSFSLRLLLLAMLVLCLCLGLMLLPAPPAAAAIRQLEEAPGQQVYQSRETLVDQQGHTWQAIAFKRIKPNSSSHVYLRLVAFPGGVAIAHPQPLKLTNSLGQTLTAADVSGQIFTEGTTPEPNVGQYDLEPLLSQLRVELPTRLGIPTTEGPALRLQVSPLLLQEWQTVAHQ